MHGIELQQMRKSGLPVLEFILKVAALMPRPRINLSGPPWVRFHGVLVPNNRCRDRVTPVISGKVKKPTADADADADADGRKEPELIASKRKGMCCTLKGMEA